MRKKSTQIMPVILMFIMLFTIMAENDTVPAANSTIKIFIGDGTAARHHMSMTKGNTSEEFRFELKGYEAKSSTYTSSNPAAFQIVSTGEGTCRVEGISEGSGLVTLTVKTTDGETLTEKVFISICTSLNQFQAKTTKTTDVYRGASSNSGVENDDKKDTISDNVQITLLSQCGNFFRFKTNDGSTFSDDSETGFIKTSDVKVLAGSIKIKENDLSLETGATAGLTAEVLPDITADKSVGWSSSDDRIAGINSSGKLTGKAEGTVKISAVTQDGTKKEHSIWVSVYSTMTKTAGYLNKESKLYKLADGKTVRGNATTGETLAITGQSGIYYRVKMDKKSLYTDKGEDEYCYVLKSSVTIPVQSVAFSKKVVSIRMNQSVRLKAAVYPETASDKTLTYTSNNPLVAKVDSRGIVTAVKIGDADITATTRDGKHIDVCSVYVSPQTDLTWSGSKAKNTKKKAAAKGKITAKGKNDSSILIAWKTFKSVKRYELQRAKSGSKKYKTIKKLGKNKKKYVDKKVKFYKMYKYRLMITRTDGTKAYSKVAKARTKDSKVDIRLKAAGYSADSIKLTWNKQKNVKHYVIMRREGTKGEFEEIKEVSRKKTSYVDKNLKGLTNYYYRVKVVKTNNKEKNSNKAYGRTNFIVNTNKNKEFFKNNYPLVCLNGSQNMNTYYVKKEYMKKHKKEDYYSPVKYQFDGKVLKIHLYIDFVTYTGSRQTGYVKRSAADIKQGYSKTGRELYKQGVKENFEIAAVNNIHEFQGIDFETKVVFHEKEPVDKTKREKYNSNQYFIEVLLGGECPYHTSVGDHWYHENWAFEETGKLDANGNPEINYFDYPRIYMPYVNQLKDNTVEGYTIPFNDDDYLYVNAHETGHVLGLADGYFDYGCDRFTDNSETGVKCKDKENKGSYDNLMKEKEMKTPLVPNDLQMMLYAYHNNDGRPWENSECYKSVEKLEMEISTCIKNTTDEYPDAE